MVPEAETQPPKLEWYRHALAVAADSANSERLNRRRELLSSPAGEPDDLSEIDRLLSTDQ
ncbi:MAG: hypothetical protein ACRD12_08115 [Acidimicrobiales bacterium]